MMGVEEFWQMTPQEFSLAIKGYYKERKEIYLNDLRRTRWQTAALMNIQLPKNKRVQLKNLLPLEGDKDKKVEVPEDKNAYFKQLLEKDKLFKPVK